MSANWFYRRGESEIGPLTEAEIRGVLFSADFSQVQGVRQGASQWFTAESVRKMFAELDAVGWYVQVDGNELGPFTKPKLEQMVREGVFHSMAWVRQGLHGKWELLEERFPPPGVRHENVLASQPTSGGVTSKPKFVPEPPPILEEPQPAHVPYVPLKRREPPSAKLALSIVGATLAIFVTLYGLYAVVRGTQTVASGGLASVVSDPTRFDATSGDAVSPSEPQPSMSLDRPASPASDTKFSAPESADSGTNNLAPAKTTAPRSLQALHQLADGPQEFSAADWSIYKEKLFLDGYLGMRVDKGVYSYKRSPTQYSSTFRAMIQVYEDFGYPSPTAKQVYNGAKILLGGRFVAGSDGMIRQIAAQLKARGDRFLTETSFRELDQ